jgi:tRNA-specific 2-thiouridylase
MKIAMLLSGGVDSSVALALLKEQGHDVTAFYLKIWLEDELSFLGNCPWEEDLLYVQKTCEQLKVPLQIVSLQKEYHEQVVSYTIAEVKAGRTPNPDVLCNQRIKFGVFLEYLKLSLDTRSEAAHSGRTGSFDFIATGHYAQVTHTAQGSRLLRAPDPVKDQTYFLAYMSQEQLARAIFPIGHLQKAQVRELAHQFNLPTKDRKDSQGICFLGKLKFNDFIAHHMGQKPGDIIEFETGKVLGKHKGFWFHTIGQRQGSGLAGGPWYVVVKNPEKNIVYMSRDYHSEDKPRNQFHVSDLRWFSGQAPEKKNLLVKIRHGKQLYECTFDVTTGLVSLAQHDQGIAPGQFAVFYDDQVCLGAGVIR